MLSENILNKIALIEWIDSAGSEQLWECIDCIEPLPPRQCRSVGFVIDDDPEYKTLTLGLSDNQLIYRLTIPTCCIKSIKLLK